MPRTPTPDVEDTPAPEPEVKKPGKPEPELKRPQKPEPEMEPPATPDTPDVGDRRDDRGGNGPGRGNPITGNTADREDAHIGATEGQVSDTTAPAGDAFKDEPRQG